MNVGPLFQQKKGSVFHSPLSSKGNRSHWASCVVMPYVDICAMGEKEPGQLVISKVCSKVHCRDARILVGYVDLCSVV